MVSFPDAIRTAREGHDLTVDQTRRLITAMLQGKVGDDPIAELLLALRDKGEAVSELVGAAQAMRQQMTPIAHDREVLLDTCGTGGSGSGTFNISTATALVVAACDVPVAKHGNRRATSRSGSADVLTELGVVIESEPETVAESLANHGICFCFAPKLHPAMRHVVNVRRALGVPTLFNLLGPLCNPAGATHQLLGASSLAAQRKIAAALQQLDTQRALVVRGDDGQDEVTLAAATQVIDVAGRRQQEITWTAESFDLPAAGIDQLQASDPAASAEIIRGLLAGQAGPCRNVVLANAAAALLLVGRCATLPEGVQLAAMAIDSGAAEAKRAALAT